MKKHKWMQWSFSNDREHYPKWAPRDIERINNCIKRLLTEAGFKFSGAYSSTENGFVQSFQLINNPSIRAALIWMDEQTVFPMIEIECSTSMTAIPGPYASLTIGNIYGPWITVANIEKAAMMATVWSSTRKPKVWKKNNEHLNQR